MLSNNTSQPDLSVIVIVLCGEDTLARCLRALARSQDAGSPEIIVPCDDRLPAAFTRRTPEMPVRFLRLAGRATYAELRAAGVREARGAIIAITEDHCIPSERWCRNILDSHASGPCAAIGGTVEKAAPDTALNWAFYLADYVRYAGPVEPGSVAHLTDCNVTYKRSTLELIRDVWANEFHENVVHEHLRRRGYELLLTSDLAVGQQRTLTLRHAIWDRYAFGRLFAATRVEHAAAKQRLVFLLSTFVLPALLVARIAGHVKAKGRYTQEFVRALPAVVLICTVWAI